MRLNQTRRIWLGLLVIVAMALVISACEDDPTEEPPAIPPSITLKPPFISQTPQFTATLTPSQTFTPSATLPPSATPTSIPPTATFTLTPTAAVQGSIISADNLNVRQGPGRDFDAITRIPPGSDVDIYESDTNDVGEQWYSIGFADEEGVRFQGWVLSRWVDDNGEVIPTVGPTPTPSPTAEVTTAPSSTAEAISGNITATPDTGTGDDENAEDATPRPTTDNSTFTPFETAVPQGSVTPVEPDGSIAVSRNLSDVNIWAYCENISAVPVSPREDQTVSIFWSWWVTRPELMQQHLDNAEYTVLLDGMLLSNWRDYATEIFNDPATNNRPSVYWYVPVGQLEPGEHTVEFRVTWRDEITDGIARFGPGTSTLEETGECTFTVTAVEDEEEE